MFGVDAGYNVEYANGDNVDATAGALTAIAAPHADNGLNAKIVIDQIFFSTNSAVTSFYVTITSGGKTWGRLFMGATDFFAKDVHFVCPVRAAVTITPSSGAGTFTWGLHYHIVR